MGLGGGGYLPETASMYMKLEQGSLPQALSPPPSPPSSFFNCIFIQGKEADNKESWRKVLFTAQLLDVYFKWNNNAEKKMTIL